MSLSGRKPPAPLQIDDECDRSDNSLMLLSTSTNAPPPLQERDEEMTPPDSGRVIAAQRSGLTLDTSVLSLSSTSSEQQQQLMLPPTTTKPPPSGGGGRERKCSLQILALTSPLIQQHQDGAGPSPSGVSSARSGGTSFELGFSPLPSARLPGSRLGRSASIVGFKESAPTPRDWPSEIIPGFLFLGGQRAATSQKQMEDRHITRYLCCAVDAPLPNHVDPDRLASGEVEIKHIKMKDGAQTNLKDHFTDAFKFIRAAKKEKKRIFVYCREGKSRSASIVIAYFIRYMGLNYEEALGAVRCHRSAVDPNFAFCNQLNNFSTTDDARVGFSASTTSMSNLLSSSQVRNNSSDKPSAFNKSPRCTVSTLSNRKAGTIPQQQPDRQGGAGSPFSLSSNNPYLRGLLAHDDGNNPEEAILQVQSVLSASSTPATSPRLSMSSNAGCLVMPPRLGSSSSMLHPQSSSKLGVEGGSGDGRGSTSRRTTGNLSSLNSMNIVQRPAHFSGVSRGSLALKAALAADQDFVDMMQESSIGCIAQFNQNQQQQEVNQQEDESAKQQYLGGGNTTYTTTRRRGSSSSRGGVHVTIDDGSGINTSSSCSIKPSGFIGHGATTPVPTPTAANSRDPSRGNCNNLHPGGGGGLSRSGTLQNGLFNLVLPLTIKQQQGGGCDSSNMGAGLLSSQYSEADSCESGGEQTDLSAGGSPARNCFHRQVSNDLGALVEAPPRVESQANFNFSIHSIDLTPTNSAGVTRPSISQLVSKLRGSNSSQDREAETTETQETQQLQQVDSGLEGINNNKSEKKSSVHHHGNEDEALTIVTFQHASNPEEEKVLALPAQAHVLNCVSYQEFFDEGNDIAPEDLILSETMAHTLGFEDEAEDDAELSEQRFLQRHLLNEETVEDVVSLSLLDTVPRSPRPEGRNALEAHKNSI